MTHLFLNNTRRRVSKPSRPTVKWRLKRRQRKKTAAAFQQNKKVLHRAEKAILLSASHSWTAASRHSLPMISIYRSREVLCCWRWRSPRLPEPCRTKSLGCLLGLHAVSVIPHIIASAKKEIEKEASVRKRDAERMFIKPFCIPEDGGKEVKVWKGGQINVVRQKKQLKKRGWGGDG